MKTKAQFLIATFMMTFISADMLAQARLEVTVQNVREAKGNVMVGLFDKDDNFLKKAVAGKVVKASPGSIIVVFDDLKPGDYALSVIHDENGNGELDSNFIGLPKEGFAFGNNAMGTFGPPSFEKAKITLDKSDVKQVIDLKYL